MKTKLLVVILLIFLSQLFITTPIFAQKNASIPDEATEELAQDLAELSILILGAQEWFDALTPEEQERAKELFIKKFIESIESDQ